MRAATRLFAAHGIAATSLRAVATAAGVSPALIVHHFASMQGLREAVDREAVERVLDAYTGQERTLQGRAEGSRKLVAEAPEVGDYLARALTEGGETTAKLFQMLIAGGHQDLKQLKATGAVDADADADWFVLHHILLMLGPLMLRTHIETALGARLLEPAAFDRWSAANERLLRHGWYNTAPVTDRE